MTIIGLTKSFGNSTIYKELTHTFPQGKVSCLLGPSGCGKTTLLNLVAGTITPNEGTISLSERKDWGHIPVGYAFQEHRLLPWMSVLENLIYPMDKKLSRLEKLTQARDVLELVELWEHRFKNPDQLSGGMTRRVGLARALLVSQDLLLLDEPLASLDQELRKRIGLALKKYLKGKTVLLVTHDYGTARTLSDHIYLLSSPPVFISEISEKDLEQTLSQIDGS